MSRSLLLASAIITLALAHSAKASEDGATTSWGYSPASQDGPSYWGNNYPTCKTGQKQSPINFRDVQVGEGLKPIKPFIGSMDRDSVINSGTATLKNTGSGLKVELAESIQNFYHFVDPNSGGSESGNAMYDLKQFYFHSPSEHTFGGGYRDAEVHFVHKNTNATSLENQYLVIGISFVASSSVSSNTFLNQFLGNLKTALETGDFKKEGSAVSITEDVNLRNVLPETPEYFTYEGSFTTPPCTEGVTWYVMKDAVPISTLQLSLIRHSFEIKEDSWKTADPLIPRGNYRPTQPVNGREVKHYSGLLSLHDDEDDHVKVPVSGGGGGATMVVGTTRAPQQQEATTTISSVVPAIPETTAINRVLADTPVPAHSRKLTTADEALIIVFLLVIFFVIMFALAACLVKCCQKRADEAVEEKVKQQAAAAAASDRTEMKDVTAEA